jgi:hypothetical protein
MMLPHGCVGGCLMTMDEVTSFLVWCLFRALIPTGAMVVCKLFGVFPYSWPWALLPTVSAGFFLASYLLAMVLLRTAQAMSTFRS